MSRSERDMSHCSQRGTWAVLRPSLGSSAPDRLAGKVCWHLINVTVCMTANDSNCVQLFEGLGALAAVPFRCFLEIECSQLKEPQGFWVARSCPWWERESLRPEAGLQSPAPSPPGSLPPEAPAGSASLSAEARVWTLWMVSALLPGLNCPGWGSGTVVGSGLGSSRLQGRDSVETGMDWESSDGDPRRGRLQRSS